MEKVVIFGGKGFIGSHLIDKLITEGIRPLVFDRFSQNDKGSKKVDFMLGDIRDREAVSWAIGHTDGAINLAGILGTSETIDNPFPSVEVNILGALNFLQSAREHKKRAVQIAVGNHYMNNSYAITKSTAERLALMYNKEHGTEIAVVRALNAYGERQKEKPVRKIVPSFITRALAGESIEIYGSGEQIMDMIYVKDVVEVLCRALVEDHGVYSEVFEAGTGVRTSVNDIAKVIASNIPGTKIDHIKMRAGEPEDSVVLGDPSTLKPLYGKTPEFTKMDEVMGDVVEWYRNR